MQQGHGLIHSPSSSAKTSKDALTESKSPSPPVQALQKCFPSPSVHRSNSASSFMYRLPHWLRYKRFMNTEGPISVSHSSIWRGFFYKRGNFSPVCTALILFLSHSFLCVSVSVPLLFFISVSYLSLTADRSPDFHFFCIEGHSHFPFWQTFFFLFLVFIVHSWIIQIADSEYSELESCSWLTGSLLEMDTYWTTSSSGHM